MSVPTIALAALAMGAGSCVQGAVGFGAALVAAPLLVLVDERFVPGPITVASLVLNVVLIATRSDVIVDHRIRWAIGGLLPGTIAGGLVLAVLSADGLSIAFAVIVVVAVVFSVSGVRLAIEPRSLAGAGVVAGVMGTVSGIGGPPIALVYQHEPAALLRGTLPRFFVAGSIFAIAAIAAAGRLGADEVVPSIVLTASALAGFSLSGPVARHLDRRSARPVVLVLSVIAAVAVLLRELL
jgi:uncharacterized membrane protein YfcA